MESKTEIENDDYDYVIELLLVGDSRVGKSCLLRRFIDNSFNTEGNNLAMPCFRIIDYELNGRHIKLKLRMFEITAEGHNLEAVSHEIVTYEYAKGYVLVYDVTNEDSFKNIESLIRTIDSQGSTFFTMNHGMSTILIGNKAEEAEIQRRVSTRRGQSLADEFMMKFFETSAKTSLNVEGVFLAIVNDIVKKTMPEPEDPLPPPRPPPPQKDRNSCCWC